MNDVLPSEAMLEAEPALGPVLRDLQAQPVNELTLRERDNPEYVLALEASSGGAVIVPLQEPPARAIESMVDAIVRVADLVQDAAVEAMWAASVPPVWPSCPRHPGTHPLQAAAENDRAVWRCPADGITLAEVGALPSSTD
jgi:hypothetical protein